MTNLQFYLYKNLEDTERGSIVVVIAENDTIAENLISKELLKFGLTFEPTNIINKIKIDKNIVLYSDSGDID
jgi:hypothetical protein